jgi:DNA-binding MarR family transcriptional regulator
MADQQTPALHAFRRSRAYRVGTLLRRLHLGLTVAVERRLHEAALTLTRSQGLALLLLAEHPGASNAELARLLDVSPQTMHQTLLRLERDGLVTRGPHPRLKRVQAHEVTAHGMALMERGSAVARVAIEAAMDGLSVAEQETLLGLLERSLAGLSEP